MSKHAIIFSTRVIICIITLVFLNCNSFGQNVGRYFSFRIKSPIYFLKYDSDSISVNQKVAFNNSIGFGINKKLNEKSNFDASVNFGFEKFKANVFRHKSPNSFVSKLSRYSIDIKLKYGKAIGTKTTLYAGLSNYILIPYKIITTGQGSADSTGSYSPDFSSNFKVLYDPRINLSSEFNLFKNEKIKLIAGAEFSFLRRDISLKFLYSNNNFSSNYTLRYYLVQPFLCVNYCF